MSLREKAGEDNALVPHSAPTARPFMLGAPEWASRASAVIRKLICCSVKPHLPKVRPHVDRPGGRAVYIRRAAASPRSLCRKHVCVKELLSLWLRLQSWIRHQESVKHVVTSNQMSFRCQGHKNPVKLNDLDLWSVSPTRADIQEETQV